MTDDPYGTTLRPTPPTTDYTAETVYDTTSGTPDSGDSPSMKDKAGDAADAGKQAATDVAQNAADQAKDVVQETKKQARDLAGEARSQLSEQAGAQHRNLVTNLRSLADELSTMAQGNQDSGIATDLVSQAGDRAHSVADWLDEREPGDLLGEARSFAQRRPGAFLLGAAVAGIVAGRLTRGAVAAHHDDSPAAAAPTAPRHQALDATPSYDPAPALGNGTAPVVGTPVEPVVAGYSSPSAESPAYNDGLAP